MTMTSKIPPDAISDIVKHNNLKTNSRDGAIYFDNEKEKFKHGYYLRIDAEKDKCHLKLECSLAKFYAYFISGRQTNFEYFSIAQAREAVSLLADRTKIDIDALNVTYYEVGANLYMPHDAKAYIDEIISIGPFEAKKTLFINPRYKGERIKTTVFHRHIKKTYKLYDKVHEMRDRDRADIPKGVNILRVETTQRRVEKVTVALLFTPKFLKKIIQQFERDWRTAQFEPVIEVPPGTHQRKVELIRQLLYSSREEVLNAAKEDLKIGKLTERRYRSIREFITREWDEFADKIKTTKSPLELEFRDVFNETLKILWC